MATRRKSSKRSATRRRPSARAQARPPRGAAAKPQRQPPASPVLRLAPRKAGLTQDDPERSRGAVLIDPRLEEGVALFNHHQFFTSHEVLEQLWLETALRDRSRDFYKGMIQAAVAFYHWSKGNPGGAISLYRSSSRYLRKYRPEHLGVDVEEFLQRFSELFRWMRRHHLRYDARLVPPIRWARRTEIAPPTEKTAKEAARPRPE